jgi:integrase
MKAKNDNTSDKSKPAYWKGEGRLFNRTWERKRGGKTVRVKSSEWCFTLAHQGDRKLINTHKTDKNLAAQRACAVYKKVAAGGWEAAFEDETLELRDPSKRISGTVTVGRYVEAAGRFVENTRTHAENARCFRQIVAGICRIKVAFDEGRVERIARRLALEELRRLQAAGDDKAPKHGGKRHSRAEKAWVTNHLKAHLAEAARRLRYDHSTGGQQQWQAKVDAVPLDKITPAAVETWKVARIREAEAGGAVAQSRTRNTVGSVMRKAASLFKKKTVKLLRREMDFPDPHPFDDVEIEPLRIPRFKVQVPWETLLMKAAEDLTAKPEMMKAFLLAAACGLRGREMDALHWDSFDFDAKTLTVKPTDDYGLKTRGSHGTIPVDLNLAAFFRRHFDSCGADGSGFVLQGSGSIGKRHRSYRCEKTFRPLRDWVRNQGIKDNKPIHHLRKLYGEAVYQSTGDLLAVTMILRHSSYAVTEKSYVEGRQTKVPSVAEAIQLKVIPFVLPEETAGAPDAGERQKKGA